MRISRPVTGTGLAATNHGRTGLLCFRLMNVMLWSFGGDWANLSISDTGFPGVGGGQPDF